MNRSESHGFSLVELAIALVIIGIILSMVIYGTGIREGAYKNATIAKLKSYRDAYNDFRERYNAVPGDMYNAIEVLGASTANGDGNSVINTTESLRAWQQLSLAGLVEGQFKGTKTGTNVEVGAEIPSGPFAGSGFSLAYYNSTASFQYNGHNALILGYPSGSSTTKGTARPDQVFNIDRKIDDGDPNNGYVNSLEGTDFSSGNCISGTSYSATSISKSCVIVYFLDIK